MKIFLLARRRISRLSTLITLFLVSLAFTACAPYHLITNERPSELSFNSYLEALRMIKDWSTGLVTVNSGLIALTGALLKDVTGKRALRQATFAFVFFLLSILSSANVIGSLPGILLSTKPNDISWDPYILPGNLGIPLIVSCNLQMIFFVAGLISFLLFAKQRGKTDN